MKGFFDFLAMFSFGRLLDLGLALVKSYFARCAIYVVEFIRSIYFIIILTLTCFLLISTGFLIIHIALFLILPWEQNTKIIFMFILSFLYLAIPVVVIMWLHSRKHWLKISGAQKIIDEICAKK